MRQNFRIIDENLNRLNEGLRVAEDYCRMAQNNETLTREFKRIRHEVFESIGTSGKISLKDLLKHRDVARDPGSGFSSRAEVRKKPASSFLYSNFKRTQESARVIEEYSKFIDSGLSRKFKRIRFRLYELEQKAMKRVFMDLRLYLIADFVSARKGRFFKTTGDAVKGGVTAIQYRDKVNGVARMIENAKRLKEIAEKNNVLFIVNDRVDVALASGADGVHLGKSDMKVESARKILGPGMVIGATAHSIDEALLAEKKGADYVSCGPIFPTLLKKHLKPAGLKMIRKYKRINVPYVVIGGISPDNVSKVINAGAGNVAVLSCIMKSSNPKKEAGKLYRKISAGR